MHSKTHSLLRHLLPLCLASGFLAGCFDSTVPGDYYPGLSDNSPPPDPSTYAVSGDVSGTLGNVTVNAIGGLTAAQISQGLGTLNTATDLNNPSTIVSRDASGNFAANVITATTFNGAFNGNATTANQAIWAGGQLGGNIGSLSAINLSGGSVFRVTTSGTLNQSGLPTTMSPGTTVTLVFTAGPVTIQHNVATASYPGLLLRGASNFRTANAANDALTFVFLDGAPNGSWVEIARHVAPSEVMAQATLGQVLPNGTEQTVNLDTELRDSRNEFGASAFLASSPGTTYQFSAQVTTDPVLWSAGDSCQIRINDGGTPKFSGIQYPTPGQTTPCSIPISGLLRVGTGTSVTLTFTVNHAGGASIAADGTMTYLTLHRIDQP